MKRNKSGELLGRPRTVCAGSREGDALGELGVVVSSRVPPQLITELDKMAEDASCTRSALIGRLLESSLKRRPAN